MLLRAYLLVAATLFACSSAIRLPPQTPLCATADCARIPRLSVDGRNGNGVVLRLQVSTLNETIALRQAADDSLLEVLASNQHWVDVRISQAMVGQLHTLIPGSLWKSMTVVGNPLGPDRTPARTSLAPSDRPLAPASFAPELFFSEYQRLSAIHIWMIQAAEAYASHTELISIGTSYEGREILGLRISSRRDPYSKPGSQRKTILVTGGAHGREWISVSSVNYLALQFMASYGHDASFTTLTNAFDWVFVPILNPDGYEYSWTHDRYWRKTRQPTHYAACNGFDLDKAWGYRFDFSTATHPCSGSFPGQQPWQATEAAQMRQWVKNQTDARFVAYVDLHSYSQQILYPYAYSCDLYPPSWENLEELAWGLARAMGGRPHGSGYDIGRACEGNVVLGGDGSRTVLPKVERGGGSSLDWFYHEARVKYAYQIKLPDTGGYGFLLPKDYIVPVGMSLLRALDHLGRFLLGEIGVAEPERSRIVFAWPAALTFRLPTTKVAEEDRAARLDAVREWLAGHMAG